MVSREPMSEPSSKPLLKRLAKNMSWMFLSQILVGLFGLASLIFTARAIGPAAVGILALVDAYIQVMDRLFRLEPWQATIKYGSEALIEEDPNRFRQLIKMSVVTDCLGGLLAGSVAIMLAPKLAPFIGLSEPEGASYITLVAFGLFLSLRPTGIGVLRIFDRFDVLAISDMVIAGLRLVGVIIAFLLDLGIWAFVALLLMHQILTGLVAFFLALAELKKRNLHRFLSHPLRRAFAHNPGYLRFLWNSNFNVILRQSTQRLDILVVGALLDVTSVGFYQVGKRIMANVVRIGGPVRQVLYPEMTRLWAVGDFGRFWRLVRLVSLSVCGVSILVSIPLALKMPELAVLLFGPEFRGAAPVMTILMYAAIVYLGGLVLNPALLSMGLDSALVRTTIVATVIFTASFLPLLYWMGIEGIALAHLLFNVIWTVGCIFAIRSYLARKHET